mgnify:CR=1 FL=1
MTNILAFDSLHIVNPLRIIYLFFVQIILKKKLNSKNRLVLYRLDKDNIFIRDKRNLSGISVGVHTSDIDALSIRFYRYLNEKNSCDKIKIKDQKLYNLYTRQVKLKLEGLLRCAHRIQKLNDDQVGDLEIISDSQTISIMKEVFLFLNFSSKKIKLKSNFFLTICISFNSIIMRAAAIVKMIIIPTDLPKEYFYKYINSEVPSILITMPKRAPEIFYESYVKKLENNFNIFIYSLGLWKDTPKGYRRLKINTKLELLHGLFKFNYLWCNSQSYIADILIIFKSHSNLRMSIDVVNSLLSNKIDVLINRQQTNVLENFLAIEARRKKIFIYGDIMEEIFDCDFGVCSSESEFTDSVKLALIDNNKIVFKGSNSLIKYRLSNFINNRDRYLHRLLGIDLNKKIIFYASDPNKEQSQRYLIEKFLFKYFSDKTEFFLVMKTHSQDDGKITNYAFLDAGRPSNTILIGDLKQKKKIASKRFKIYEDFDFHSAIANCDGFLTATSSSILEALVIGTKAGVIDFFGNGFYNYLIKYNAVSLINNDKSLTYFLSNNQSNVTNETLHYCGLKNENEFNIEGHIKKSLRQHYQDR